MCFPSAWLWALRFRIQTAAGPRLFADQFRHRRLWIAGHPFQGFCRMVDLLRRWIRARQSLPMGVFIRGLFRAQVGDFYVGDEPDRMVYAGVHLTSKK
jgi:hypothetical protein